MGSTLSHIPWLLVTLSSIPVGPIDSLAASDYNPVLSSVVVTRTILVARDQVPESELESGAHRTLILVAIGLGFLFTATAIIFYLFPVSRIMGRVSFLQPPAKDSGQVQKSTKKRKIFQPTMTSTPRTQMPALPQRLNKPSRQPRPIPIQMAPAFFAASMPRVVYPVPPPPHWPNASYNGLPPGFYNHRIPPPIPTHASHRYRLPYIAQATLPPPLSHAHINTVSRHIAAWMKIADDVVGPHPFAKPLPARVATQAEIDFISGRIPVRWALDGRRSRPTSKVLGSVHNTQKRSASAEKNKFPLRDNFLNRVKHHTSPSPKTIRHQSQNMPVAQNHHAQKIKRTSRP